jgi:hypothetical protein
MASIPVTIATLDLGEISPTRSTEPRGSAEQAPHLQKAYLDLTILLPLGTEDGEYAIELRNQAGDALTRSTGKARWDGTAETLATKLDLRALAVGRYTVALREAGSSWRTYPVILEDLP